MRITTVLGDIEPEQLGLTSFHEHILAHMDLIEIPHIPDAILTMNPENMAFLRESGGVLSKECRLEHDIDFATAELTAFQQYVQGRTVCDASPIGMRGDIRELQQASQKSGVNLVCCTGLYLLHTHPHDMLQISEDALVDVFSREISEGINGTDVHPGFVKCAIGTLNDAKGALHEQEMVALKACARAAQKHGLALQVHTARPLSHQIVLDAVDAVLECGVEPDKLVMLHMDAWMRSSDDLKRYMSGELAHRSISLELPLAVLERGCNIGFDSWGSPFWAVLPDDYDRIKGLLELLRLGYEDRITLGHDMINKAFGRTAGHYGFTRFASLLPQTLSSMGIAEIAIQKMMIHNPARILQHSNY